MVDYWKLKANSSEIELKETKNKLNNERKAVRYALKLLKNEFAIYSRVTSDGIMKIYQLRNQPLNWL